MLTTIIFYAAITALATGLGALPFFFIKNPSKRLLAIGNAIAAGFMFGAAIFLIREGNTYTYIGTAIGTLAGALFIIATEKILKRYEHISIANIKGAGARQAILIVTVMTVHSFAEGVGIGVSFGGTLEFGIVIAIAMAIHNIPEGLAISLVLVPRGTSPWKAVLWSIFSSLPQVIMVIPAYLFVENFSQFLAPGLGFAAGAMIFMCFSELIPESMRNLGRLQVVAYMLLAVVVLFTLQMVLS